MMQMINWKKKRPHNSRIHSLYVNITDSHLVYQLYPEFLEVGGCSIGGVMCLVFSAWVCLRHTFRQSHSELTFRPSRAPESRGTLPSFMRLLSKIRPMRRSPSLDGCHVTGCYKVRATHLLFNNPSAPMGLLQTKADKCLQ